MSTATATCEYLLEDEELPGHFFPFLDDFSVSFLAQDSRFQLR